MPFRLTRGATVLITTAAVCLPLALIVYQSLLSSAFFSPDASWTFDAFRFVLSDPEFWVAVRNSLLVATGMVAIALPLGGILAFVVTRTDLPGIGVIETRSEEHTSELQSLMRISYAVFCL